MTEATPPVGSVDRSLGASRYPLVALGFLVVVDQFQSYGLFVLGPEVTRALGLSRSEFAALINLKILILTASALPVAAMIRGRPRRALFSVVTAFGWALATLTTGFVTSTALLAAVLIFDGVTTGSVQALHRPLLIDSYPPSSRVRVLSGYRAFDNVGNVLAPALVGLLTAVFALTWRGVFVAFGVICLMAAIVAIRLKDPGLGANDEVALRRRLRSEAVAQDAQENPVEAADTTLGFGETVRRLMLIGSVRRILWGYAALGMLFAPLNTYLIFFLEDRWGMSAAARGAMFALLPLFSITALALFARRGESMFQRDPGQLVGLSATMIGAAVVLLGIGVISPVFSVMVLCFGLAFACFAVMYPALETALLSVVPAASRSHASALAGIYLAGVGGTIGLVLLGSMDRRFGITGAIASILVPGLITSVVLRRASRGVAHDIDRLNEQIADEERAAVAPNSQLLEVRGLDFSYGPVQVLFDVDFTVSDGEMVALLGTNGAGKSTLLRVVSGLGLPSRGSVRLDGHDVTFLDADRRARLGITQVPGGKAVFGPLSVVDNLRVYGHALGSERARLSSGIDEAFDAFPRLAERRNQAAHMLSGGEQQMLALARALILRPRLLLIDELSLGLAPIIVGELLEMVRRINSTGTSIVLVEQSVNVALSLVDHAYFMERGRVRFDGKADELLGRSDLLRAVFLEGAP
ncbi:MAG: ABC-type branched-subunit amino acid transport system ATPase component/MFS family permease [Glaciecola sp.]